VLRRFGDDDLATGHTFCGLRCYVALVATVRGFARAGGMLRHIMVAV
jgi:hypothetical protein